ncbi:MAG: hypothetical protein PVG78_06505 [Desulfobacterales bacterium]|jgi:hypothetical protein
MGEIVDFQSYRNRAVEERAFAPWKKRFSETFGTNVYLSDLSDATLMALAQPGEDHAVGYYELVMAVLNLGEGVKFYYLDKGEQLRVVDIHLFLADQVRFELMRRLGWVERYPGLSAPIVELVAEYERYRSAAAKSPPTLAHSRPDFDQYQRLTERERESFIRRLLPQALEAFRLRLSHGD